MEAIRFTRWDKKVELVNIPIPRVSNPEEILVKIIFAGISPKNLRIITGDYPCNRNEGFILGHEVCGIISDIGEDVMMLKKRDRVAVDPYTNCGVCTCCRSGKPHLCQLGCTQTTIGVFRNGGWAEYIVLHQSQVYKLPEGVTLEQAVLTEPMSYVSHGWHSISPIPVGVKVLVMGAGLTGLLWIIKDRIEKKVDIKKTE